MASTVFQDYDQNNPIVSSWLNDINAGVYSALGSPRKALASSAAWVRFSATGGVVSVLQSSNVASVTRTSQGIYVITYTLPLTNAANCYDISLGQAGFAFMASEAAGSLTINTANTADVLTDPTAVSVVVYGAN